MYFCVICVYHVCVCVFVYVLCVCVCMCLCMYVCVHMRMHVCMSACVYVIVCARTPVSLIYVMCAGDCGGCAVCSILPDPDFGSPAELHLQFAGRAPFPGR